MFVKDLFFWAFQINCPANPERNGRTFQASCNGDLCEGTAIIIGRISNNVLTCKEISKNVFHFKTESGEYVASL